MDQCVYCSKKNKCAAGKHCCWSDVWILRQHFLNEGHMFNTWMDGRPKKIFPVVLTTCQENGWLHHILIQLVIRSLSVKQSFILNVPSPSLSTGSLPNRRVKHIQQIWKGTISRVWSTRSRPCLRCKNAVRSAQSHDLMPVELWSFASPSV